MIPNVDRWSKKVSNFSSVCFQVSLSCQRRLTRNDRSISTVIVARQLFFLKFSVSKWFHEWKRSIDWYPRNDIHHKFVAENSRVSDRIKEEHRVFGSCEFSKTDRIRTMGRSTCFARLWERIMGSLQIIIILRVYNLVI